MRWLPWILACVWLGWRWGVAEYTGYDIERGRMAGVLANLLILLIVLFTALVARYRKPMEAWPSFMDDVRTAASAGMRYVVAAAILIAVHYYGISPELTLRRDRDRSANAALVSDPAALERIRSENAALRTLSPEDLLEAANDRTDLMTSPGFVVSSSVIGLILTALAYSFLAAFVFRQFIRRSPPQ